MVNLFLKQVVAWTGNLKETEDIENKLDKTSEPDGALIYLKVFIKIAWSDRRKTYFLGRLYDLRADSDFHVFLQWWIIHGLNVVAQIYLVRLLVH